MIKERMLQSMVIKHLEANGWEYIELNNLSDLKSNFRNILNERNQDNLSSLNKESLSDREFERYMSIIENNATISEFARFFMDDDNQIATDENDFIYLNIFNKKEWCNNKFQVAQEVSNNGIRHDLLLLINGLPICNIELKRRGVTIGNAFNQTKSYSNKQTSLFKFIQLFVISNEDETRYYANNEVINKKFTFKYSDKDNNPIDNIFKFVETFLDSCTFSKYISRYIINKESSKTLIALRGYQVHGAEKAINHLATNEKNGYLWHATGSGKTITSFKVAQIVAKELKQFEKVIFLVDRKDLDTQTIQEYNSFLEGHNKIQETKSSRVLLKQLINTSASNKLIITTIQKMDRLLKSEDQEIISKINSIKDLGYVFIIDECHRSQFGEMNSNIRDRFENIKYIGFTGTPIFKQDDKNKMVTNDIFDENLHKYLMQNAIEDGSVLPFHAQFLNDDREVDDKDIGKVLKSPVFLKKAIKNLIEHFDRRSINRKYSSLVVLKDIKTLILFYRLLKEEQEQQKQSNSKYVKLNVAATFSFSDGYSDKHIFEKEALKEIISDFNSFTDSNESVENIDNYQNRLQHLIKDENVTPSINVTLVVDQLLTGFDAKRLNVIYLLRNLKRHTLIQAISRTNRVFMDDKEIGQIISFVPNQEEKVNESIKIYSNTDNVDLIIKRDYEAILTEASKAYKEVTNIDIEELMKNPSKNVEEAKKYIREVNKLSNYFKLIRTIDTYDGSKIGSDFNLEKLNTMVRHSKTIKEVYAKTPEWEEIKSNGETSPLDEVDSPLYVDSAITINSEYIRTLLGYAISDQTKGNINATKQQIEEIKRKIDNTDGGEKLSEVFEELLEKFSNDATINVHDSLREIFDYKMIKFRNEYKIQENEIDEQIYTYKLKEQYAGDIIDSWIKNTGKLDGLKFLDRLPIKKELKKDIHSELNLYRSKEEIFGG